MTLLDSIPCFEPSGPILGTWPISGDRYLEFMLKLLLDPFCDMDEGDLSFPQLGADLQIQLWWSPEAVPRAGRQKRLV